jgi:fatty-acid peroxygenase
MLVHGVRTACALPASKKASMNTAEPEHRAPMRFFRMPKDDRFESGLAFLADPYRYIREQCRQQGSDLFEARILLRKTVCMTGPHAAELFYDPRHFVRAGAAPEPVRATLFGKGGVQGLDGEAHRHRKAMLMDVLGAASVSRLVARFVDECHRSASAWRTRERVVLYEEAQALLTRSVCDWAGVPVPRHDLALRTAQLASLFNDAAALDWRHLRARYARARAEQWLASFVGDVRAGRVDVATDAAAWRIAMHRGADGELLGPRVAAVELLNLLRPTVAVAVFIVFVAHALHEHPECRQALQHGDDRQTEAFVNEVRRFYPFFPALVARARHDFEWNGYSFRQGRRAMLDVYGTNHDPRCWQAPDLFRPERFIKERVLPFGFIPQGGGDAATHHRCPGEGAVVGLMKAAAAFLANEIRYELGGHDLRIDMARAPALPKDRLVLRRVRPAG